MSDPATNTEHMRDLISLLNAKPWTDEQKADACASVAAALVLYQEGRGATKTWNLDLTVKGVRSKMTVTIVCDSNLDSIAKG